MTRATPIERSPRRDWATASDEDIVRSARRGDDAAFSELHRRYRDPLLRVAGRMLGPSHHALDDVVQDVLHHTYLLLGRPEARPLVLRPWLFRLVRNRCIDELRSERRGRWTLDVGQVAAPSHDVWCEVATRLVLRETMADIAALPQRQRAALVAVAIEGRSHEDVAAELDASVQASKTLVSRARGELVELRDARNGSGARARRRRA